MKRFFYIIILSVLFDFSDVFSQNWQQLSPYPSNDLIGRFHFYNSNLGIGAGDYGDIIRTTDGGTTWNSICASSFTDGISDVFLISPTVGYACGYQFTIYKTTNAGITWNLLSRTDGAGKAYDGIVFTDENTGYVVGDDGRILKTIDGGTSWSAQTSGVTYTIMRIIALNSSTLVAVGYGGLDRKCILKTTDGGTSWNKINIECSNILNNVHTPDNVNLFAVGANGSFYKSTDEGETWNAGTSPSGNVDGTHMYGVFFTSSSVGYVTDRTGKLYKTINGGTSWTTITNGIPPGVGLSAIWFVDSNTGFLSGDGGVMLKTTDAGNNWTSINRGIDGNSFICAAWFTDNNTGYAGDMYSTNLFKTTDGGNVWINADAGISGGTFGLQFVDNNTGFGITDAPSFYKTNNAGATWTEIDLSTSLGTTPTAIHFVSSSIGYIVGGKKIIKTINGGTNWVVQKSDFPQNLNSCYFLDENHGYVAGAGGYIAYTTNSGIDWTVQTSNTTNILKSIIFYNDNIGAASGNSGTILRTTDGGSTWINESFETIYTLSQIKFIDQDHLVTCGALSLILVSNDGGSTWNNQSVGIPWSFYGIALSGTNAWLFGDMGFIYKNTIPLPVELTSFTANQNEGKVVLKWSTATEVNNYGFQVQRKKGKVESEWEVVGFVEGNGNSNSPKQYSFVDENPIAGNLQYRLKQIDTDGNYEYYSTIAEVSFYVTSVEEKQLPTEFALEQNYPNPFNPSTTIKYTVPVGTRQGLFVQLRVYDVLGNEVATLVNENKQPGYYNVNFNGSNLSTGMYICKLTVGNFSAAKKLMLMK